MSAAPEKVQDMPPSGGYRPINYKRVSPKVYFNGRVLLSGYALVFLGGSYIYYLNYKLVKKLEIETRSANMAITPLLQAERDRAILKQLVRNRNEETILMKNVEGWKVGTYYGEPIFKSQGDNYTVPEYMPAFYAHCAEKFYKWRTAFLFWYN